MKRLLRRGHSRFRLTVAGLIVLAFLSLYYALSQQRQNTLPLPHTHSTTTLSAPQNQNISMAASLPTRIDIPSISVTSSLARTGLNADGTPAVPVGADVDKASWLTTSATPGETGTSVIIGHVDTVRSGPSVFYNLGKLTPGDTVYILREDSRTAVFTVQSSHLYNKDSFPSANVYGRTSTATLRLITCAGEWDQGARQYTQNLVVYAALSGVR
jgi:sortase (surface protein transpeptidase)